jgi:hypothetical protein
MLNEMRWTGQVACMGKKRNAYTILVGKPEGKRLLGRHRCRREDSITMDLRKTGWDDMNWIHLAQNRDQWQTCEHGNEPLGSIKF